MKSTLLLSVFVVILLSFAVLLFTHAPPQNEVVTNQSLNQSTSPGERIDSSSESYDVEVFYSFEEWSNGHLMFLPSLSGYSRKDQSFEVMFANVLGTSMRIDSIRIKDTASGAFCRDTRVNGEGLINQSRIGPGARFLVEGDCGAVNIQDDRYNFTLEINYTYVTAGFPSQKRVTGTIAGIPDAPKHLEWKNIQPLVPSVGYKEGDYFEAVFVNLIEDPSQIEEARIDEKSSNTICRDVVVDVGKDNAIQNKGDSFKISANCAGANKRHGEKYEVLIEIKYRSQRLNDLIEYGIEGGTLNGMVE